MTDTKPTLPELIDYQQRLCENNPPNPVVYILTKEIRDSLKELAAIKEYEEAVRAAAEKLRKEIRDSLKELAANAERWRQVQKNPFSATDALLEAVDVNNPCDWLKQSNEAIDRARSANDKG